MNLLIAVPSTHPGGLDAELGAHFGHCDLYTLVTISQGAIGDVQLLPAMAHQQGGCMAPVQYLATHGVRALVAGGMGLRPLMGFNQVGIEVYYGAGSGTVREAVQGLIDGRLPAFTQEFTCGGGGGHAQPGL